MPQTATRHHIHPRPRMHSQGAAQPTDRPQPPVKTRVQQPQKPTDHAYPVRKWIRREPGFQDLLKDDTPNRGILPDTDRVDEVRCFIARDSAFFQEVEELHKAVVVTTPTQLLEEVSEASIASSFAKAAGIADRSLEVKMLSASRFLVISKDSVDAAQCASLLPEEWWNQGYKAERWSPMLGAGVQALRFKVWVELVGLPPHLRKEAYVAQAAGQFGVYLGSVPQHDPSDFTCWGMVVATPDLRCVPRKVTFTAGALEYPVKVVARRWMSGQVYGAFDFPKLPEKIVPPSARSPVLDFSGDSLTIKLHDLKKIFRHVPKDDIPTDIRIAMAEQAKEAEAVTEQDPKGKGIATRDEVVVRLLRRDLSVVPSPSATEEVGKKADRAAEVVAVRPKQRTQQGMKEIPQKINKRGREEQSATVAAAGKRTIRPADRAAQVLLPSFLSLTSNSNLGEISPNLLFPELEEERGGTGLSPVIVDELEPIPISPVNSLNTLGPAAQLSSGPHNSLNNLGPEAEVNCELNLLQPQSNSQMEAPVNAKSISNGPKKHGGRSKAAVGTGKNNKADSYKIAVIDEKDFVNVPLAYHETFDVSALIGVSNSDVQHISKAQISDSGKESRIKSRPATKDDLIKIPSPLKDKGANSRVAQQIRARGKEAHKKPSRVQAEAETESYPEQLEVQSEEEVDYSSE